jgi:hypothetical protein
MAKKSKPVGSVKRTRRIELEVDLKVLAIDSHFEPITKAAYEYRQKHVYPYLEALGITHICYKPILRLGGIV